MGKQKITAPFDRGQPCIGTMPPLFFCALGHKMAITERTSGMPIIQCVQPHADLFRRNLPRHTKPALPVPGSGDTGHRDSLFP